MLFWWPGPNPSESSVNVQLSQRLDAIGPAAWIGAPLSPRSSSFPLQKSPSTSHVTSQSSPLIPLRVCRAICQYYFITSAAFGGRPFTRPCFPAPLALRMQIDALLVVAQHSVATRLVRISKSISLFNSRSVTARCTIGPHLGMCVAKEGSVALRPYRYR